jgi:hypothetical protein
LLDISGDMHALDGGDVRDASRLQPIEEFDGGARIGSTCVGIANIGGEEFKEAKRCALTGGGDEGMGATGDKDEPIHALLSSSESRHSISAFSARAFARRFPIESKCCCRTGFSPALLFPSMKARNASPAFSKSSIAFCVSIRA